MRGEAPIDIDLERSAPPWKATRAALVIAHPGHELRVHHWLEQARPLVLVLTDGSGHTDRSRLASTTVALQRVGAVPGQLYGRFSDREFYRMMLAADPAPFFALAEEIARVLDGEAIDYVVGDAVEGFNPGHDVCRLLLNAALLRIEQANSRSLRNYEFLLEGAPHECPLEERADAIWLELGEDAYRRKLETLRAYPEMAAETARLSVTQNLEAFRIECLRPVRYGFDIGDRFEHPPIYEQYGTKRVEAGFYREVIRYREHLAPLAERLRGRLSATEFASADPDKDGTLSKDEYLKVVESRFKAADPDNDGTLDEKELRSRAGQALLRLSQ
jgi:hypothetical protein